MYVNYSLIDYYNSLVILNCLHSSKFKNQKFFSSVLSSHEPELLINSVVLNLLA